MAGEPPRPLGMNMAGDPYPELPRAERKRLISRAVLLDLLTTAVLMVL